MCVGGGGGGGSWWGLGECDLMDRVPLCTGQVDPM